MSQVINLGTGSTPPPPGTYVETLTGNSGGAVAPDIGGNINLLGDSVGIVVIGNPGTNTLEIAITDLVPTNFDGDSGTANPLANTIVFTGGLTGLVFNASGNTVELSGGALEVDFGGTGNNAFTPYAPIVGGTTNTGILQSAATGFSNVGYVLTSTGSSSLPTWQANLASGIVTLAGNSGSATGVTVTVSGGNNITTTGSASTLSVAVTGTTNHAVQIGNASGSLTSLAVGTTGQVLTGVTGSDPVWAAPAASSISITGNSGGALVGNAFTFTGGTTGLTFSGAGTTETLGGTLVVSNGGTGQSSLTAHNLIIGNGTTAVTLLAPSATSGIPLISQGAAADPAYGTAVVAGGGTGNTTFTAYSVICAGTTATGAFQNVSGLGSAGNVLTSNGAGALPSWQAGVSGGITTIDGDTGSVTGSTVMLSGDGGFNYAGSTVRFQSVSATDMVIFTSDSSDNTFVGSGAGVVGNTGGLNIAFGGAALSALSIAPGVGAQNTAFGYGAGGNLVSGSSNVIIGNGAGTAYTTSESNNIIIGSAVTGTVGESSAIRIGDVQTTAYIAGIASVAVSNKEYVTIDTTTGQLGSDAGPSGGITWSVITADQTAAVNNGYIANKAGTLALALPATSAVGDIIEVTGINTATGWRITQASGQQIFFGASSTTLGATGTLTSSAIRDALRIVCITANTTWQVLSCIGNISVV